ncbi:MAG: nucleotide exchange factor GrpE [Candidatus Caenarcaniphilales bacterium]|nr:nucleotide exchange factor GrpE [Candidatus Caenarcaniphilales bacterium]
MSDQFVSKKKADELQRKLQQNMSKENFMEETNLEDSYEISEAAQSQVEEADSQQEQAVHGAKQPPVDNASYEQLKKDFEELDSSYKRLWADQQNMLKRFQKEKDDLRKFAAANTIEAILPALDNFDFAKKSLNQDTAFEEIIKSFDMLKSQFQMALQAVGLSEIATNVPFDPTKHEAVTNVPSAEHEPGTIIEVVKPGYILGERVVRAATVVVASKPE